MLGIWNFNNALWSSNARKVDHAPYEGVQQISLELEEVLRMIEDTRDASLAQSDAILFIASNHRYNTANFCKLVLNDELVGLRNMNTGSMWMFSSSYLSRLTDWKIVSVEHVYATVEIVYEKKCSEDKFMYKKAVVGDKAKKDKVYWSYCKKAGSGIDIVEVIKLSAEFGHLVSSLFN